MTFDSQGARSIPAVRVDPPPPQVEAPRPSGAANSAAASKALSRRDFFAHDDALGPVADLLLNAGASTPLSAGLFAGPGAGKSAAVDRLAALLQQAIGPSGGARMTGGGFGGAVVALMPLDQVDQVRAQVLASYRTPTGDAPRIMVEKASEGVSLI